MKLSYLLIALFVLGPLWLVILRRWERGVYLLLLYLPVSGIATVLTGYSTPALLFKDIAFVIPTYASFFFFIKKGNERFSGIPRVFVLLLMVQSALVLIQMFNPSVPNWMVALIGAKVWLFYIPLFLVSYVLVHDRRQLVALLRPLVILSWIPAVVGIGQWVGSNLFGHARTLGFFYGDNAYYATQKLGVMNYGAAWYRIPSTFSFVTQYVSYLWVMIVLSYMMSSIDPHKGWRTFAKCTFTLAILATFLSGSRGSFVIIPLFVGLMFGLEQGILGGLKMFALIALVWIPTVLISQLDLVAVLSDVGILLSNYTESFFIGGLVQALEATWIGLGTGINTNAARYGYSAGDLIPYAFENYYAKAIAEIGILGVFSLVAWQVTVVLTALNSHRMARSTELRGMSAALCAFLILIPISQFKGFALDIDPINVYYWILLGITFRLNSVLTAQETEPYSGEVAPKIRIQKTILGTGT